MGRKAGGGGEREGVKGAAGMHRAVCWEQRLSGCLVIPAPPYIQRGALDTSCDLPEPQFAHL